MKGTHVLFVSSWYPNRNDPSHGIFNRAFARAAALRNTVSVLHVCPDDSVLSGIDHEAFDDEGIFTVRLYYPSSKRLPVFFGKIVQHFRRMRAYKKGYRIIEKKVGKPSLIQLNVAYPAGTGVLMLSSAYRIPFVMNECWTGYDPLDGRYRGALLTGITRRVVSHAKKILPVSAHLLDLMKSHGLKGEYEVVPNVVDVEVFRPREKVHRSPFTLIHISALDDAQKNVSGIILAFGRALKTDPSMRLIIAGDGADAGRLRQMAAPHGDAVVFIGKLAPAQLALRISDADALVMFSNYETFCVAVPEALACGKPVITSDAGGIMSYFNDRLGLKVRRGDIDGLTTAIIAMRENKDTYDPQYLREFVVERFAPARVGAQLDRVYKETIGDK